MDGAQEEYAKRHDSIWPELKLLLKDKGVSEYFIFFGKGTGTLCASLSIDDLALFNSLANYELMNIWWAYMADLMVTNEDNSPRIVSLKSVFYLE